MRLQVIAWFLFVTVLIMMLMILFGGCTAIRKAEEYYFYKVTEDIIATEYEDNPLIEERCVLDYTKPIVIDLKYDALNGISRQRFPVMGMYHPGVGYIVYSSGDERVLIHEYFHHFTRDSDLACLKELSAAMAMTIYELRESKRSIERKYYRSITRPTGQ